MDFYNCINTYARLRDISWEETLHQWYCGRIDAVDLLAADLEDEGIFGYTEHLVDVIRVLGNRSVKDGYGNPWFADD